MTKEAIILAGGLGTRLRSAVPDLPKCMAPVAGKPFLDHVITFFLAQGIEKFIFSLGYMHTSILEYLYHAWPGLNYAYTVEEQPLGTGGAIALASQKIESDNFIVTNGDTLFKVDLEDFDKFHTLHSSFISVALKPMFDFDRYGSVTTDGNDKIISFQEKKHVESGLINGGLYIIDRLKFSSLTMPDYFSFEKSILENQVSQGKIFGYTSDTYFIDIGIPQDYVKASIDLAATNKS